MPIPLNDEYVAEFDNIDKNKWSKIIDGFLDANIYQTWSYDAIRCGENNISHFILKKRSEIVAGAQIRIVRIPILRMSAAYVRWGPFWQNKKQTADIDIFRHAIRALRNEYALRRGMILRIYPLIYDNNFNLNLELFKEEGYRLVPERNRQQTLIIDIRPQIEELRKKLDQKWRNCLNKAERSKLEIIEGTDDGLFVEFISIYEDLLERKKFTKPNDINEFRIMQRDLPPEFKMRIFICRSNGVSSAGAICTAIGETGVYLFGATNEQGMANKGSYLVQWKVIQWLKNQGCRYYNLNGINPKINPGTYHFKAGLSGKNGKDVFYLGRFDCYSGPINAALARTAEFIFPFMKKTVLFRKTPTRIKSREW